MSKVGGGAGGPWNNPIPIGDIAAPPFVRLPDPLTLFAARVKRFRTAAAGHELGPYLHFLGDLSDCQHRVQAGLPELSLLKLGMPAEGARARDRGMPLINCSPFKADAALEVTLERMFALAAEIHMPGTAREALMRAGSADAATRHDMIHSVLADAAPVEALADYVFVAAALQVHFARIAGRLDPAQLAPVANGACPVCGGTPVISSVGWKGAHGARFCACSLCATQWHVVRIKCVPCDSTKGIGYQELEGGAGAIKAETCEECRGYVKILHQHIETALDPVADDVATLGLDLLLRERGYRRGAVNPFLVGY